MKPKMLVKKLSENAKLPMRKTAGSVGYDLFSSEDAVVQPRGKALVRTDISIKIPEGTYARIAPRSGLAWKNHMDVGAGVIDPDYRGNICVVLFNHSENEFSIKIGDSIAQLILEKCLVAEVEEVRELDETERGDSGFGSTTLM